jgi:hypothetical protein
MKEKVIITDTFYLDKFMEIQRQNVVLSNKLRDIYENPNLRNIVEIHMGPDFFNILQDTPA